MKAKDATELAENICLYFGASEERTFHGVATDIQALIDAATEALRVRATQLEAALRLLREECQDEGRCSQVGHRVSLPCVKLVDEALGIAPPFGAGQ